MAGVDVQNPLLGETTCGSLLHQLQKIWDEVGESDEERDKMLLQLEQECLNVYKRKVEQAAKLKAHLLQALADSKLEFSTLLASLGEKSFVDIPEKTSGTIKDQLAVIAPALQRLWKQKDERVKEFTDVQIQIQKIRGEIAGSEQAGNLVVDESDLSLKKLNEFHDHLQELQKEKNERLNKVLEFVNIVHDICAVLGIDFYSTVTDVHPSLNDATSVQSKSISNDTLARLAKTVLALKEAKKQRLQKVDQVPITENLQTLQKGSRTDKWETKEDVALMSAWIFVNEVSTRGNNQRRTSLWARAKEYYDAAQREDTKGLSIRNENQMKGRWKRLNENANKWIVAYREAYRQKKSGMSMKDVEKEAHAIYEAGGSKFNDSIVFNEVMCKHPKWELQLDRNTTRSRSEYEAGIEESGGSTKKSRTSEEGDYYVHTNQESPTVGCSTIHRPTGRDAAKKKGKDKVSQSSLNPNEFVAELRAIRITRDSEVEVMSKRLEFEQQKEERKKLVMHHKNLNILLVKEHLSQEDEEMKRRLLAMLYGK